VLAAPRLSKLEPKQRKGNEMAPKSAESCGASILAQDVQSTLPLVPLESTLSYSLTGDTYLVVDLSINAFLVGMSE
jgi:hypothetical protein